MRATEILMDEHRVIEQMLSVMDEMADRALQRGTLDSQGAAQAIDFIRTFADKCHHAKEEDVLFVSMEAVGFPHDNGPIAVMLHDHDSGRAFVRAMADVVDDAARGDTDALRTFANNARSYTEMLRAHIQKEDRILYPMADQSFDDSDEAELLAAFQKADNQACAGIHERYLELARTLAGQYGISEGGRPR
ncbi:MAG: hemerythrin domain-containing protein [Polyangia bacterium]